MFLTVITYEDTPRIISASKSTLEMERDSPEAYSVGELSSFEMNGAYIFPSSISLLRKRINSCSCFSFMASPKSGHS